jgi:outer membrane protein insertion porin family
VIMAGIILSGCTALKYVPEDELLYTGADVKIAPGKKVEGERKIKSNVKDVFRPESNASYFGMRPQLWIYYVTGNPKRQKGLRNILKTKLGEPPVYMSNVNASLISKGVDAKLYNNGFFDSYNRYIINDKEKTSSLTYTLYLNGAYKIADVIYPSDSSDLSKAFKNAEKKSLINKGDRYNLDVLVQERERIDTYLKNNGFYYFNGDYILYTMDTSVTNHTLRLHLTVKRNVPEKAKKVFHIGEVNLYPDYKLGNEDSLTAHKDVIDSVNYYAKTGYIRPAPVLSSVFLKNNTIYSRKNYNLTLNRLNGLGVFKLVNVKITNMDSISRGLLLTNIYLSPLPKKSISIDVQGISKSNNFVGPGLDISLRNKNAFKGAELLVYNVRTSFETQLNGPFNGQFTYELNPRVELYIPRFITPFKLRTNSLFVPRTKFTFDYSYLSRVGYFDMNSFKYTFGYKWKQTRTIDHDLTLLSVNYFKINNTTQAFKDLVGNNAFLKRRFEEQFIEGIAYSFTFNQQVMQRKINQLYFNGNIELAGNSLSFYHDITSHVPISAENPAKILSINYAQFARFDIDFRDYYHIRQSVLASRFIAGWGIPYGNSSVMPYSKQFFSGGAYSVRGFQAYSLGPGSYAPPDSLRNIFFLQQGGEIKLEANVEYRFPIISVLKGALFTDAGNTWLNKPNPLIPGGEFSIKRFYNEIAAGVGLGLRIDLSFFVLRFDLGMPVRKPWLPEDQRWVFNKIAFSNTQWRRDNLIFNIAFGYPF